MTLTADMFDKLQQHWAIRALSADAREIAQRYADEFFATQAVGKQIEFSFAQEAQRLDTGLIERVLSAYEIAAIENIEFLYTEGDVDKTNMAKAASHVAFSLMRCLPLPQVRNELIFHVLKTSSIAYCGDRWSDIRRFYDSNRISSLLSFTENLEWDNRILINLFECWIRLFRKDGWDDIHQVCTIVEKLREAQKEYEHKMLRNSSVDNRFIALKLLSLYHLARATELLALFLLQGENRAIRSDLDKHFEASIKAANASGDLAYELLLRWLYATSVLMVQNSLWWVCRTVNSRMNRFVDKLVHRGLHPVFEMLPPQRSALLEQGFLDPAKTAIVVDMPTSGGKTLLAEFRILQALNHFSEDQGWVAYIAPTKALVSQITRRLRRDFESIDIRVEQLSAAVEFDMFEERMLSDVQSQFDILVSTPEKLSLLVRNKKIANRPLALAVVDEAHNIENDSRGLRLELLLSTIKQDCSHANFLLLMPSAVGSDIVSRWLAQDATAGHTISLSTTPWSPNERIIGLYRAVRDSSIPAGWHLEYETLTCTAKALKLSGTHKVGGSRPLGLPASCVLAKEGQKGFSVQTAIMAAEMSSNGTSIAMGRTPKDVWSMARLLSKKMPIIQNLPNEIRLVQKFLKEEVDPEFELIHMLEHGIGVHHSALSDEIRALIEWLAENGHLKVLCATTTLAQGIDFPVSSVFIASKTIPTKNNLSIEIPERDFWNLIGRVGRMGQDSIGVIGIAEADKKNDIISYICRNTSALVSRLVKLLDELMAKGELLKLSEHLWEDQWEDFRSYIAHLYAQKRNLEEALSSSEQLLRQTLGYTMLKSTQDSEQQAEILLDATKSYVKKIAGYSGGVAQLADATGFSPEGVIDALKSAGELKSKLHPDDWLPESLFGEAGHAGDVFGAILKIKQLERNFSEFNGESKPTTRLGDVTRDWVNGERIIEIAKKYFSDEHDISTEDISRACKAIYKSIVNNCTWGVSAISHMSGISESLTEEQMRKINAIPAMVYHGVNTEEAVLMRMNSVPRTVAVQMGEAYKQRHEVNEQYFSPAQARKFIRQLSDEDWSRCCAQQGALTGAEYKYIWQILSGDVSGRGEESGRGRLRRVVNQ